MLPPSRPETEAETTSQEYMEEDEGFEKVLGMTKYWGIEYNI